MEQISVNGIRKRGGLNKSPMQITRDGEAIAIYNPTKERVAQMEQVNIREFRTRLSFWLNNLPIQITSHGEAVAEIHPVGIVYTQDPRARTQEADNAYTFPPASKAETIAALRSAVTKIENQVNQSTGEISQPTAERRTFTEYVEESGEEKVVTGTLADFILAFGTKSKATAAWRTAKKQR